MTIDENELQDDADWEIEVEDCNNLLYFTNKYALQMQCDLGIPKEYLEPTNKSIWKETESQNSSKFSSTVKFSFIETKSNHDKYNSK